MDISLGSGIKAHKENEFSPHERDFNTWELDTRWHLQHSELFYVLAEWQTFPSLSIRVNIKFHFFFNTYYVWLIYVWTGTYVFIYRLTTRRSCSALLGVQMFDAIGSLIWPPAVFLSKDMLSLTVKFQPCFCHYCWYERILNIIYRKHVYKVKAVFLYLFFKCLWFSNFDKRNVGLNSLIWFSFRKLHGLEFYFRRLIRYSHKSLCHCRFYSTIISS